MSNILTDSEWDRLHRQLVILGDLIGNDDEYGSARAEYNREYRKIAKILYPEMYKTKARKPDQRFVNTLMSCICGSTSLKYKIHNSMIQITCAKCDIEGEVKLTKNEARDSWNKIIKSKML